MFSEELLRFIRESVTSVWALEALLILRRDAGRAWSVDELTREMRGSPQLVAEILKGFAQRGLAKQTGSRIYRYRPTPPELDTLAEELAQAYQERPISVMKAIASAPNDKIQTFADAFKLRRD